MASMVGIPNAEVKFPSDPPPVAQLKRFFRRHHRWPIDLTFNLCAHAFYMRVPGDLLKLVLNAFGLAGFRKTHVYRRLGKIRDNISFGAAIDGVDADRGSQLGVGKCGDF